jgi:hypothetical protein
MTATTWTHVSLGVTDIARSRPFFGKVIEISESVPGLNGAIYVREPDGQLIALFPARDG